MAGKRVFCIRNDRDDNFGIAGRELAAGGVAVERLDGFAPDVQWPGLAEMGGLVVFGGGMNVDDVDLHPYLLVERELMRTAVDAGVPVLGICLGAQLLARALGARVYRAPVRELGFKPVDLTSEGRRDLLLRAFDARPCVFQWHEDTFELPERATLLATADPIWNQAFRIGDRAWGVQFHFEVNQEGIEAWLDGAGSSVETIWRRKPEEVRSEMSKYLSGQQDRSIVAFAAFARLAGSAA